MRYLLIMIWSGTPLMASAEEADSLFSAATDHYGRKHYPQALAAYQAIEQLGYTTPELYYNLGNCYFRLKEIGRAILYYEKALRLDPDDEDARFNLDHVRLYLKDQIVPIPRLFLIEYPSRLMNWIKMKHLIMSGTILWYVLLTVLSWTKLRPEWGDKMAWPKWRATLVGAILAIGFLLIVKIQIDSSRHSVIILQRVVEVKNEPDLDGPTAFLLHEGTKVDYLDASDVWIKIRLPDGKVGWVQDKEVGLIE